jgi:hypothetical protein
VEDEDAADDRGKLAVTDVRAITSTAEPGARGQALRGAHLDPVARKWFIPTQMG